METNQEKKPLENNHVLKQINKVLVPGDDVTIKFHCNKFAYLELIVREIPTLTDDSIVTTNG